MEPNSTRSDLGDTNVTQDQPNSIRKDPKSCRNKPVDPIGYYKWLSMELRCVHDAVKVSCKEVKKEDKVKYDRAHKEIEPTWKVSSSVLLQESTVKPGSSKVITKQRFVGPTLYKILLLAALMSDRPIVSWTIKPERCCET